METKNFSIRESDGATNHIGTIVASKNNVLKDKILRACSEHFCIDARIKGSVKIKDYVDADGSELTVTDADDEEFKATIFVCQTWIY